MAAGEQVALEPALAHGARDSISITRPSGARWSSVGRRSAVPRAVGHLEDGVEPVRAVSSGPTIRKFVEVVDA